MTTDLSKRTRWLIEQLASADPEERESAALSLNIDSNPVAIQGLRTALQDPVTDVREAAAQSLALLGDVASFDAVIDVAKHSDAPWPRASLWAACALAADSSDVGLIERVRQLIEDLTRNGPPEALEQVERLRGQQG